jgi:hypothetical protein
MEQGDQLTANRAVVFWGCSVYFWRFSARVRCQMWVLDFMFDPLKHYIYLFSTEDIPFCVPPPPETRTATMREEPPR